MVLELRRAHPPFLILMFLLGVWAVGASTALANPFEDLPETQWTYGVIEDLVRRDLADRYVVDRIRLGYRLTYFDAALSVGQALKRMEGTAAEGGGAADVPRSLDGLVEAYNGRGGTDPFTAEERERLRELIGMVANELEILGYPVPSDVPRVLGRGRPMGDVARALTGFTMQGESTIRYSDAGGLPSPDTGDGTRLESNLEQSYTLRLAGAVSDEVNIDATVEGVSRLWNPGDEAFQLRSGAVAVGVSGAGVARVGTVSGNGFSDVVVGEAENLTGLQAGWKAGQLGSNLLIAKAPKGGEEEAGTQFVTAWDGAVQVNDRLNVAATVARLEPEDASSEGDGNTVLRLGGAFSVSPALTVLGEMAQSTSSVGEGGAVKVGAVLHPLPELTLGAEMLLTDPGFRRLFSDGGGRTSRFDLSAAISGLVLSVSRQRVAAETGDAGGAEAGIKTEFGVELPYEGGRLNLGYVLEGAAGDAGGEPVRMATASVEHAVGPIGRATAGFSIVDQVEGNEASGNVGLTYDFENATLSLQYEINKRSGETQGNVTTAEFSIRF